tara:strand:+ start:1078 stop:1653 length:576 start_codon:yes stop_codon:yes gene_type:complete
MTSILKVDELQDSSGNLIIKEVGNAITIGASGDTITVPSGATITNSGTATGFGKILQVVTATDNSLRSTTSTSYVTASNTLAATITPSATSSKIFVTTQFTVGLAADDQVATYTIYRDSTDLGDSGGEGMVRAAVFNAGYDAYFPAAMSILDSPSSTSALTYQVYLKTSKSTGYINYGAGKVSLTAFEVAG